MFDKIDNGKDGLLTSSKSVDLIEKLEVGFHSEDLEDHMWIVYPN